MLKTLQLTPVKSINIYYNENVYDPTFSAVDTVIVADMFLPEKGKMLDVACGSGVLALALKCLNPKANVHATDIDPEAVRITEHNSKALNLKVTVSQGNLIEDRQGFDLIVANLPTFDDEDMNTHMLHGPRVAYYASKKDGLKLYKQLFKQLSTALQPEGVFVCECQAKLQEKLENHAHKRGWQTIMKTDACLAFIRK